jgi:hypothetical protein
MVPIGDGICVAPRNASGNRPAPHEAANADNMLSVDFSTQLHGAVPKFVVNMSLSFTIHYNDRLARLVVQAW